MKIIIETESSEAMEIIAALKRFPKTTVNYENACEDAQGTGGIAYPASSLDGIFHNAINKEKLRCAIGLGAISPSRQAIVSGLMNLIDKGAWNGGVSAEEIKALMQEVLGQSEMLWQLLERGRGDRLRIVWQNLTGYFMDRQLLPANVGAPALNKMFFGDTNNYSNIDKGRPSKGLMTADFESVVALLDQHIARMGNLTKKA